MSEEGRTQSDMSHKWQEGTTSAKMEYICMLLGKIQNEVKRFKSHSLNTYSLII